MVLTHPRTTQGPISYSKCLTHRAYGFTYIEGCFGLVGLTELGNNYWVFMILLMCILQ